MDAFLPTKNPTPPRSTNCRCIYTKKHPQKMVKKRVILRFSRSFTTSLPTSCSKKKWFTSHIVILQHDFFSGCFFLVEFLRVRQLHPLGVTLPRSSCRHRNGLLKVLQSRLVFLPKRFEEPEKMLPTVAETPMTFH